MADDTFEYITTDFMVSIDSGTPSVQPVEYIIELGEQGIPGIQGEQGEPGYSPVVNYTWNNDTIQFTLVNRDYTETTPNLYDYVLKKDGSNANNPITLNHLTMGYEYGSPYINSDNNLYIRGEIISLQANNKVTYNNKEIATVDDIGNGTITLTQGGVTKGTFTTNQSGNTTIDLDVGGGELTNPLVISNEGGTRNLTLGINESNNKVIATYGIVSGGGGIAFPIYLLGSASNPLVLTEKSGDGLYDLTLNIDNDTIKVNQDGQLYADIQGGSAYTAGTGISIVNDTISIDNTVALKTDIPSLTGYATENWVTNQGYTTNVGTVTSVNNIQPDANGNISINIPDVSNFVTTNTTQTILGDKTFTQNIYQTLGRYLITNGVKEAPGGIANIIVLNNSNIEVGNSSRVLQFNGSSTRPTYNNNDLALLSDIGSGGGAVDSVNGQTGDVVLTASDVGALPDTIVIPTKTSDLTNDSGFITSSDIPTNYVTTNTTQSISGIKTFTNAIHTDLIQSVGGGANLFSYSTNSFSIGTANTRLYLYGNTLRPTYYYNGNTELALLSDIPTVPTIDQNYDSSSTNPQSGTAVAEAIASVTTPIATSSTVGTIKPDNTTTKVDANGTLSAISRNIGEIVQSTIPLTDAGLHLLDGSLIQGGGIYQGFVDYIAELYNNTKVYNPSAFTVVGSPTITADGIASGFSNGNYLTGSFTATTPVEEYIVKLKIKLNSIPTSTNRLWTLKNTANCFIALYNNAIGCRLDGNNNLITVNKNTDINWDINQDIYIMMKVTASKTYLTVECNGNSITKEANTNLGFISMNTFDLGGQYVYFTSGSIDLKQFSITVDGVEVFSGSKPANYFTDEANWQQSVTTYGVCGKFVYDSTNNTVRLPKITGIIEGTVDATALGDLVEAGLPNILGAINGVSPNGQNYTESGSYYWYRKNYNYPANLVNDTRFNYGTGLRFDASRSSSLYKNNFNKVQPQTIKILLYIVIATSSKTDIQVDIDNIATDLNGKADNDLSNINNTAKVSIAHYSMPSNRYINLSLGANGTTYTAPADGYIQLAIGATGVNQYIAISPAELYTGVGNSDCLTYSQAVASQLLAVFAPVRKGERFVIYYTASGTVSAFKFIYAVGSASEG